MTENYVQRLLKLYIHCLKTQSSLKLVLTLKTQFENICMTYFEIFCNINLNIIVLRKK